MAIDPVCGMTVDEATAAGSITHDSRRYLFCSTRCLSEFRANPARFVNAPAGGAAAAHHHAAAAPLAQRRPGRDGSYESSWSYRDRCGLQQRNLRIILPSPSGLQHNGGVIKSKDGFKPLVCRIDLRQSRQAMKR